MFASKSVLYCPLFRVSFIGGSSVCDLFIIAHLLFFEELHKAEVKCGHLCMWSQVKELKKILRAIPEARREEMRRSILKVYPHLTWNDKPRPYDAFHSTLFTLWTKRHTFRTRPRPVN